MSDFNIFYLNFYINLKYCCHRSILQDLHFRGQKSIGNYKMLILRIVIIIIEILKIKTLVLCVAKLNYLKFQNSKIIAKTKESKNWISNALFAFHIL